MKKRITVPSSLNNIKEVIEEVLCLLNSIRAEESDIFDIKLGLEESLVNAIKHGNGLDEKLSVDVDFEYDGNKVLISVEDKGGGFDYHGLPDPTKEENLLKAKGRGVFLIRHIMDSVEFNKKGNRITMTKFLRTGG